LGRGSPTGKEDRGEGIVGERAISRERGFTKRVEEKRGKLLRVVSRKAN